MLYSVRQDEKGGHGTYFEFMKVTPCIALTVDVAFATLRPNLWNSCGLYMRRECRERFPLNRGLEIPTWITAHAWRTCRVACRDRYLAVSFEVGDRENVPGIPGVCTTRNFMHLVRGPCVVSELRHHHSGEAITQINDNLRVQHTYWFLNHFFFLKFTYVIPSVVLLDFMVVYGISAM